MKLLQGRVTDAFDPRDLYTGVAGVARLGILSHWEPASNQPIPSVSQPTHFPAGMIGRAFAPLIAIAVCLRASQSVGAPRHFSEHSLQLARKRAWVVFAQSIGAEIIPELKPNGPRRLANPIGAGAAYEARGQEYLRRGALVFSCSESGTRDHPDIRVMKL